MTLKIDVVNQPFKTGKPMSILAVMMLVGCTSWPDQKGGGQGESFSGADYYLEAVDMDHRAGVLKQQVELLDTQLDVMVMQGAKNCIPAAIKQLALHSQRVRREIVAELNNDAATDLVIYQHNLREVKAKFWHVASRTQCHRAEVATTFSLSPSDHANADLPVKEPSQLTPSTVSLNPALALSVHFDTSSANVAEGYSHQLHWLASHLTDDMVAISIIGYADSRGESNLNGDLALERANNVAALLTSIGVSSAKLTVISEGESKPVLSEASAVAYALNRRVDILVSPHPEKVATDDATTAQVTPTVKLKQWENVLSLP